MIGRLRKQRFAFITVVYWFLLIYIVAALVWWFISLENQNNQMFSYRLEQLNMKDTAFQKNLLLIQEEHLRKTGQYIGEGVTFLLLILVGAVFVYRATRKQIVLSQQQQNFMMAVTHELKTPIAVTRLNLETLLRHRKDLDEVKQEKLVRMALQEADRLNGLTNNILIASQLESGNYALNKQQLDLSGLVHDAVKDFKNRFSNRSIEAHVDDHIAIAGESMLLRMVINNLLENAIKYSDDDSLVSVRLKQKNDTAIIEIADEGEGIPEAEKKKIFEKFYRIGNETTRKAKGTGLGLYLCKRIIHDHKGSIAVQDNAPKGSKFIVTLQAV